MHRRDLSRRNKNEPARPYDDAFYIPRQAKAHRRQQCIVSPLQNLPNEILLDIISHLLTVDVLSLCVTSKELQALCNVWGRISRLDKLINAGRKEFAYRCHHHRFQQMCDVEENASILEISGAAASAKLLCSFCLDFHPASTFDATEVRKTSRERQCKGSKASLYICPILKYTFLELISLRHGRDHGYSAIHCIEHPEICCLHTCNPTKHRPIQRVPFPSNDTCRVSLDSPAHGIMCPSNNTCRLSHYNHISNSELENRQYLKQLLWYRPNYVDRGYDHAMPTVVRQTLAKLDQYICPHYRTSDNKFWTKLGAEGRRVHLRDSRDSRDSRDPRGRPRRFGLMNLDLWPLGQVEIRCEVLNCGARFECLVDARRKYISMVVQKTMVLGLITDKRWLAST
jgi:hypothetical protein